MLVFFSFSYTGMKSTRQSQISGCLQTYINAAFCASYLHLARLYSYRINPLLYRQSHISCFSFFTCRQTARINPRGKN